MSNAPTRHEATAAEVEAARAAYLANGGKITPLAGFTGTKPLPERRAPAIEAENISGQVSRKYIAAMLGVSVKSCFSATAAHRRLLPNPVGRKGGFMYDKADADESIAAIRKVWAARDDAGKVDRRYFAEALGMTHSTLFCATSIWDRHLPAPIESRHFDSSNKHWYDKKEADKAIRKIKKILRECANANA